MRSGTEKVTTEGAKAGLRVAVTNGTSERMGKKNTGGILEKGKMNGKNDSFWQFDFFHDVEGKGV